MANLGFVATENREKLLRTKKNLDQFWGLLINISIIIKKVHVRAIYIYIYIYIDTFMQMLTPFEAKSVGDFTVHNLLSFNF